MAPRWEAVRTRESFEIDTSPSPPRKRPRECLNKRFTIIGGIVLVLVALYFSSTYISGKNALAEEKSTSSGPVIVDTPQPSKADASSEPSNHPADAKFPSVPPSSGDRPVETPPIPSNDVIQLGSPTAAPTEQPATIQTAAPKPESENQLSTVKAAVIIETRPLSNLVPIILHFSSILGPSWPIHIFTDGSNAELFSYTPAFQRGIRDGIFRVRSLPIDAKLNTHAAISGFFTKPWFWEQMAPAEHLLLFQTDSILCSNSPQKVEYFFEYDFVGAPIDEKRGLGMGYNGGLSLRNRTLSLEITKKFDWQEERHGDHSQGNIDYEDQWFSKKMKEVGANLPTTEVAMEFAVETMWGDKPLGYHQPNVWQKDRMDEIEAWCPEIKMCTSSTFTDHNTEDFGTGGA